MFVFQWLRIYFAQDVVGFFFLKPPELPMNQRCEGPAVLSLTQHQQ